MLRFCTSFFFNDTATTEIYTLSLHDALPIFAAARQDRQPAVEPLVNPVGQLGQRQRPEPDRGQLDGERHAVELRSEEHTSELQSHLHLLCPLLLHNNTTTNIAPVLPFRSLLI